MATGNSKYKLIRVGRMLVHRTDQKKRFYRLQALCDIPLHGVKAGDFGGYVTKRASLSQENSCWIGGEAQVIGDVKIKDNVLITDEAVVRNASSLTESSITKNAKVSGRSTVKFAASTMTRTLRITDDVHIYGDAVLDNICSIEGTTQVYENAYINGARRISDSKIFGNSKIDPEVDFSQATVFGNSHVGANTKIRYSVISGNSVIGNNNEFSQLLVDNETIAPYAHGGPERPKYSAPSAEDLLTLKRNQEKKELESGSDTKALEQGKDTKPVNNLMLNVYEQVCAKISSYEADIVKLIKYPVMADKTNPFTLDMVMALNTAESLSIDPDGDDFKEAVVSLQKAFIMAESNAMKIASTILSEAELKKVDKAKDLLAIAANEGSSENEKKVSFKQAFKQLEGVIAVPEVAVDTFRIKIGLPELEM